MALNTILDQPVATGLLRNVLQRGRVPHGLLFWGPGGVGKRMTATAFAQALNCTDPVDGDACGKCRSCVRIPAGQHPDVIVVEPAKKSRNIPVSVIDEVVSMASLRPHEGQWRVTIFLDAERMHEAAQNHFLKTLEEPPGRSAFILVSEQPRMLLPTIRSRCQLVRFQALAPGTVSGILQGQRGIAAGQADTVARLSQGQMDRAFDLLDSDKRELALALAQKLREGEDPSALATDFAKALAAERDRIAAAVKAEFAEHTHPDRTREEKEADDAAQEAKVSALASRNLLDYLYLLEAWYRDEMVYAATGDASRCFNTDQTDTLAKGVSSDAAKKIAAIEEARLYIERFIQEERVFRGLFFNLAAP